MITNLNIRNIALIGKLDIALSNGLNVLSGETGAGKSIIIDSLAFVLGERADKTMIKFGQEQARVEVVFQIEQNSNAYFKLDELGFEQDTTLIISRTLTTSGKNECRINGRQVTTAMLKELTSCLVDIFGQSQHQNLFKVDNHIKVLDAYMPSQQTDKLSALFKDYKDINSKLLVFGGDNSQRQRLLDILNYQIDEITKAELSSKEEDDLLAQKARIANAEKIVEGVSVALDSLSQNQENAINLLSMANSSLNCCSNLDSQCFELQKRIKASMIELDDVCEELSNILSQIEYEPNQIDILEQRIELYKTLKRKYGQNVDEINNFLQDAIKQFDMLSNATEQIAKLQTQKDAIVAKMYDLSCKLSLHRKQSAKLFKKDIEQQLADLGMQSATFDVFFSQTPTLEEYSQHISSNGFDKVEFMLSANLGEPTKQLAKVISGGEMSRFMLAIKNITARIEQIPTMIFDEIDLGISGNIAQKMAIKLANVSKDYQCIVITHLPQVAAIGDYNLLITKSTIDDKTSTNVTVLDQKQKISEIARLTGGENISSVSLVYAEQMIEWANSAKSKVN
ncbi:MAG: DNA repair protein RecN [Clostridia bacterium]